MSRSFSTLCAVVFVLGGMDNSMYVANTVGYRWLEELF